MGNQPSSDFGVTLRGDNISRSEQNYILSSSDKFELELINCIFSKAQVTLTVDGRSLGTHNLCSYSNQTLIVDPLVHGRGKFAQLGRHTIRAVFVAGDHVEVIERELVTVG